MSKTMFSIVLWKPSENQKGEKETADQFPGVMLKTQSNVNSKEIRRDTKVNFNLAR